MGLEYWEVSVYAWWMIFVVVVSTLMRDIISYDRRSRYHGDRHYCDHGNFVFRNCHIDRPPGDSVNAMTSFCYYYHGNSSPVVEEKVVLDSIPCHHPYDSYRRY